MKRVLFRGTFRGHIIEIRTRRPYFYAIVVLFPDDRFVVRSYATRPDLAEQRKKSLTRSYNGILKNRGLTSYWQGQVETQFPNQVPSVSVVPLNVIPELVEIGGSNN